MYVGLRQNSEEETAQESHQILICSVLKKGTNVKGEDYFFLDYFGEMIFTNLPRLSMHASCCNDAMPANVSSTNTRGWGSTCQQNHAQTKRASFLVSCS